MPPRIDSLSLHDALPISAQPGVGQRGLPALAALGGEAEVVVDGGGAPERLHNVCSRARCRARLQTLRSEEHTSELQSRFDLVCRLLLEKKNQAATSRQNT